jgi:hypothetical protein
MKFKKHRKTDEEVGYSTVSQQIPRYVGANDNNLLVHNFFMW